MTANTPIPQPAAKKADTCAPLVFPKSSVAPGRLKPSELDKFNYRPEPMPEVTYPREGKGRVIIVCMLALTLYIFAYGVVPQ